MQPRFLCAIALSVLTVGLAVSVPAVPALAQGTRVSEPTGGFSYVPPPGWHTKPFPGLKYKICYTNSLGGFAPNINILEETAAVPLDKYMQISLVGMKQAYTTFAILSQKPFVTASGIRGVRMVVNGTTGGRNMHQVFYVFPGANDRKYVVTASSLASDGNRYNAATDASMKTFRLR